MKAQRSDSSKSKRQKLYKAFIDGAAKLYGDALVHNKLETNGLIDLQALVSQMRVASSRRVIESAVKVVRVITETFSRPNKTPEELEVMISDGSIDVLRSFSEACREEFEESLEL